MCIRQESGKTYSKLKIKLSTLMILRGKDALLVSKFFLISFKKKYALKGKNLLPVGANSSSPSGSKFFL